MAYLEERNGRYRVAFRYGGKSFKHNLGAVAPKEAESCLARIEENLRLVERGRLEIPDGADLALFLVSDGKVAYRYVAPARVTLGQLRDQFLEAHAGRFEANTMTTARIHFRHLVATFGEDFDLARLDLAALERHIRLRAPMPGRRGRPLSHETIRKDFKTFSAAWTHATRHGLVSRPFPSTGLIYPKTTEKAPLRT